MIHDTFSTASMKISADLMVIGWEYFSSFSLEVTRHSIACHPPVFVTEVIYSCSSNQQHTGKVNEMVSTWFTHDTFGHDLRGNSSDKSYRSRGVSHLSNSCTFDRWNNCHCTCHHSCNSTISLDLLSSKRKGNSATPGHKVKCPKVRKYCKELCYMKI